MSGPDPLHKTPVTDVAAPVSEDDDHEPLRPLPVVGARNSDVAQHAGAVRARRAAPPATPQRTPDPAAALRDRYKAALATLEQANISADAEDKIADQRMPKTDKTKPQIQKLLDAATAAGHLADKAIADHPGTAESDVAAFETSVATLKQKYLSIPLYSKDEDKEKGEAHWTPNIHHDYLGNPGFDGRLTGDWNGHNDTIFKFAVPADGARLREKQDPKTLTSEIRIGPGPKAPNEVPHVQVAGGPSLAAGLLRFHFDGGSVKVSEIENTSSGFRPGPLRNSVLLAALAGTKYSPATADDLAHGRSGVNVHNNKSGTYNADDLTHKK